MGWLGLVLKIRWIERREMKKASGKTNEQSRRMMMIVINRTKVTDCMRLQESSARNCCHQGKIAVNNLSSLGWVLLSVRSPSAQLRQRKFLSDC